MIRFDPLYEVINDDGEVLGRIDYDINNVWAFYPGTSDGTVMCYGESTLLEIAEFVRSLTAAKDEDDDCANTSEVAERWYKEFCDKLLWEK